MEGEIIVNIDVMLAKRKMSVTELAEKVGITSLERRKDYMPISIRANMEDLSELSLHQNFVPVSDDDGNFIGIVTRQEIIKYLKKQTAKVQEEAAEAISRAEAAEKELSELKNSGT